jgi:hypothetical protein
MPESHVLSNFTFNFNLYFFYFFYFFGSTNAP